MITHPSSPSQPRRGFRRVVLLLVTISSLILCFLLSAGMAPHAQAALDPPTCTGTACSGLNPYTTYCAGQTWDIWQRLQSTPLESQEGQSIGNVELWYSRTCQTFWSRIIWRFPTGAHLLWATSTVTVAGAGTQTAWRGDGVQHGDSQNQRVLLSPQEYAHVPSVSAAHAFGWVALRIGQHVTIFTGQAGLPPAGS